MERVLGQIVSLRAAGTSSPGRSLGSSESFEHAEFFGAFHHTGINVIWAGNSGWIDAHDGHYDAVQLLMKHLLMKNAASRLGIFLLAVIGAVASPAWSQSQQQPGNTAPPPANSNAPIAVPAPPSPADMGQPGKPAQAPALKSSSDLVRIDVEVTDKSGKPIKGLRADQFVVTDDGKPQTISNFSYADIEKVETATEDDAKPIVVSVLDCQQRLKFMQCPRGQPMYWPVSLRMSRAGNSDI